MIEGTDLVNSFDETNKWDTYIRNILSRFAFLLNVAYKEFFETLDTKS